MGGGSSKKSTVGYKYHFGQMLVLASNAVTLTGLYFQDKLAWEGNAPGGTIAAVRNQKSLFGGQKKEGGVDGNILIQSGNAGQTPNAYLELHVGESLPAYLYCTTAVFIDFYHGNNPYPKTPVFRVTDEEISLEWLPELATKHRAFAQVPMSFYITMDYSGSMLGSREVLQRQVVADYLKKLKETEIQHAIHIAPFGSTAGTPYQTLAASQSDYDAAISYVENLNTDLGNTRYDLAVAAAPDFFTDADPTGDDVVFKGTDFSDLLGLTSLNSSDRKRILLFLTDGEPTDNSYPAAQATLDSVADLNVYAIGIDTTDLTFLNAMDNTASDGVPVITSETDNGYFLDVLLKSVAVWTDINPVHMFFDVVTAAEGRQRVNLDLLGDSLQTMAETLKDEEMFLSFQLLNSDDQETFIQNVERHIDGKFYFDQATGKWEGLLIREGDPSLYSFDLSNVSKWHSDISQELEANLPNTLLLTYKDYENLGENVSLTFSTDTAEDGNLVIREVEYEGCWDETLATQLGERDLNSLSTSKWSGTITVPFAPTELVPGRKFTLTNNKAAYRIDGVEMRVVKRKDYPKTRTTEITFIQDVFGLGAGSSVVSDDVVTVDTTALAPDARIVEEAPYYLLVQDQGQSSVDDLLEDDEFAGFLHVGAGRPNGFHTGFLTYLLASDGTWEEDESVAPALHPAAAITNAVSQDPTETEIVVPYNGYLLTAEPNSLALLGQEYVFVTDATSDNANTTLTFTVSRGALDTTPVAHDLGTQFQLFSGIAQLTDTEYLSTDDVSARLLTETTGATLALYDAVEDDVTFASRAIRPLPPGNVTIDLEYVPVGVKTAPFDIVWARRNRTLQTAATPPVYVDVDVTPEVGTTFYIEIDQLDGQESVLSTIVVGDVGDVTAYTWDGTTATDASAVYLLFKISAVRDGYSSWTSAKILVQIEEQSSILAPTNVTLTKV